MDSNEASLWTFQDLVLKTHFFEDTNSSYFNNTSK